MSSRPWYRRYPADYAADTAHLSLAEHGAYTLLLDFQYQLRTGFEPSSDRVQRLLRSRGRTERRAVLSVLEQFFHPREDDGGRLWNPRAHQELMADNAARKTMSEQGRKGAEKRWGTPQNPDGVPYADPIPKSMPRARGPYPEPDKDKEPLPAGAGPSPQKANGSASPSKGTRLPDDWLLPPAWASWALSHMTSSGKPHINLGLEADKFRDHWLAASGARGVKRDWQATWRNWIRRALEFNGGTHETHQRDDSPIARMERAAGLRRD